MNQLDSRLIKDWHNRWKAIFDKYKIHNYNFNKTPFIITNKQIYAATSHFTKANGTRLHILRKQDTRESRPAVFIENSLFLLPVKNGTYAIVKGEGYIDIPTITEASKIYTSKLNFPLDSAKVGNSEMQHLDFAYASSLIRTFLDDDTLVLTIRGRKYTPPFSFHVGNQNFETESVQTEVDAGYEGKNQIALIEAKNSETTNVIIRQLFYPFRQWSNCTQKKVVTLFFEKRLNYYSLWQFEFKNKDNYNSINLVKSLKFEIIEQGSTTEEQ